MVGIIQEQHPDRARLFMQWKEMSWPILVDSLDLLGVEVVPITLLIDEHGVVQARNPRGEDLKLFLETEYPEPNPAIPPPPSPDLDALRRAASADAAGALRDHGDALFLWGGRERIDDVVQRYQRAAELSPDDGEARFRLGVALRRRLESRHRRPGDFQAAVEAWGEALAINPNQYIWRRRIQQYGPRLDKPYPFYDWVTTAVDAITERGEEPVTLLVQPGGAEFAQPAREFAGAPTEEASPDPDDRIHHDQGELIRMEFTVVPATVKPGGTARVHVTLRPDPIRRAHWNNEANGLVVWVEGNDGVEVDRRTMTLPNPEEEVSQEPRELEFEVRIPANATGEQAVPGYALYYVCEDEDGTCLYRRQNLQVTIPVSR
jgi:hypothetical protein